MKLRMIFSVESGQGGARVVYKAGEAHDFPDDQAKKLISEGRAEPFRAAAPPKTGDK